MFNPEKVEQFISRGDDGVNYYNFRELRYTDEGGVTWVKASDYDQLLEIHLRHVDMIAGLFTRCGEPLSEDKIASLKNGTWV